MKIFTVSNGKVVRGANVESLTVNGMEIPVITVGERGRGRELAVIPISLFPEEQRKFSSGEEVTVNYGVLGTTRTGRPKIIQTRDPGGYDRAIVILRTPIGYRGSNRHTGLSPDDPFPGEVIARGVIAEGAAGRAGSGTQLVAVIPKDTPFRTSYLGRRYGQPGSHIYILYDGELKAYTQEEWDLAMDLDFSQSKTRYAEVRIGCKFDHTEELLYQFTGRRDLDVIYQIEDYIGITAFDGSVVLEMKGVPTNGKIVWLGFRKMREERLTDILEELLEVVAALEPHPIHPVRDPDFNTELRNENGVAFNAFGGQIRGEYLHDPDHPEKGIIQWFKFSLGKYSLPELIHTFVEIVQNIETKEEK